jgi:hypothetical protein
MNIKYHFIPHTFHYAFIRLQRNKGLLLRSLPLHAKQPHVDCKEGVDRVVADFLLPNSDNSVSSHSQISGSVLNLSYG